MSTDRGISVKIEARKADLTRTGVLSDLASLTFTERWMDVGGWIAVMPTVALAEGLLTDPGAGLVVVDDRNRPLFSGSTELTEDGTQVAVTRTRAEVDGVESDITTITGTDDLAAFRDRVAHPAPVTLDSADSEYDLRVGAATTVLLGYIGANAGPLAYPGRAVAGLVLGDDPAAGSEVVGRARFQPLLELLRELALIGGATVTVHQDGAELIADAFATVDRTNSVVFAPELGNVARMEVLASRTDVTDVLVAGQGEGVARMMVWRSVAGAPARRIERFLDRRDLPTVAELEAAGDAFLAEFAGLVSVEIDPIDTETFRYGRDYRLGDLVGVRIDGDLFTARVTACTSTIKAGNLTRTLTIGIEPTRGSAALLRAVSNIGGRVSNLERIGLLAFDSSVPNTFPIFTSAGVAESQPITAAGLALLDDPNNAAQRVTLGIGQVLVTTGRTQVAGPGAIGPGPLGPTLIAGSAITFVGLVAGDVVDISGSSLISCAVAFGAGIVIAYVNGAQLATVPQALYSASAAGDGMTCALEPTTYTVPADGDYTFDLRYQVTASTYVFGRTVLLCKVFGIR